MPQIRDIDFFKLPCLIIVADKNREKNGDFLKVAHITRDRTIQYENVRPALTQAERASIEEYAQTADPNISFTQQEKWFRTRPNNATSE